MRMWRRTFLGEILTLALAAFGRGVARAQNLASPFRPLARPVVIPLEDLATPWRARSFVADGVTLASAATPNQPVRVTGMVIRTIAGSDQPEMFAAVCVRCPHEGCDVEFLRDADQLPPEVKGEIGRPVAGSVYVCPCHNSTFAASDGSRLAGPAPRGLYRFKVTGVTPAALEIAEVEEDVLIFV
jgi:Rieske Fe-S protein